MRAERQGAEWGSALCSTEKTGEDTTFCSLCEPRGPVVPTEALSDPDHHPHPYAQADPLQVCS